MRFEANECILTPLGCCFTAKRGGGGDLLIACSEALPAYLQAALAWAPGKAGKIDQCQEVGHVCGDDSTGGVLMVIVLMALSFISSFYPDALATHSR